MLLRSRKAVPKATKCPPSPTIGPSTPDGSRECSKPVGLSPISGDSSCSPDIKSPPTGLGVHSSLQAGRRRSRRLASMSPGQVSSPGKEKLDISDPYSGRSIAAIKEEEDLTPRVLDLSRKKSRDSDSMQPDSSNVKRRKCRSSGGGLSTVSINSTSELYSVDAEGATADPAKRKTIGGMKLCFDDDQLLQDCESKAKMTGSGDLSPGSTSKAVRRRSRRLEGKRKPEVNASFTSDQIEGAGDAMDVKVPSEMVLSFCGVEAREDAEKEGSDEKQKASEGKMDSFSGMDHVNRTKRTLDVISPASDCYAGDGADKGTMGLRSGSRISRRTFEAAGAIANGIEECKSGGVQTETKGLTVGNGEKANVLSIGKECLSLGTGTEELSNDGGQFNGASCTRSRKRYTKVEKGKRILTENDRPLPTGNLESFEVVANDVESDDVEMLQTAVGLTGSEKTVERSTATEDCERESQKGYDAAIRNKERFLKSAKHFASRFAHCDPTEEVASDPEVEIIAEEADSVDEDWPGPFSTALRIIKERAQKLNARLEASRLDSRNAGPVINWSPSRNQDFRRSRTSVPSLFHICFSVLCNNADAITSLEGVPDVLRTKLCDWLCNFRKMNHHILGLVLSGSPSEVCIKDCSFITEEQFQQIFEGCNTQKLKVLQLDLCGRPLGDFVLRNTVARSANNLSSLTSISLRGAYQLSDEGLCALVSSTPSLKSINLSECSLLTSNGINLVVEKLGSELKKLYMDECQNIDAMLILPALKKLQHLEILSVAGIQNVCDKFVCQLVPACGRSVKELFFSNCGKLSDISLKSIAENCSGLRTVSLVNLVKLTDLSLQYLANGCRSLQVLQLCRNAFSDEGIAAFLESSGESLTELSFNSIKEVGNNTAIALAARSKNLLNLDLSWCRKLTDEGLGLIVDNCLSLRLLKLFGCTQVTEKFLDGHSNASVKIIGLKTTPITEHFHMLGTPHFEW